MSAAGPPSEPQTPSTTPSVLPLGESDDSAISDDARTEEVVRELAHVLEMIPGTQDPQVLARVATHFVESRYQGPLPSPRTLAGWKQVDESIPIRALEFAEREQAMRHEAIRAQHDFVKAELSSEAKSIELDDKSRKRGQDYALIIVLVVVVILGALSWFDKRTDAFAPVIWALGGLATAFIIYKAVETVANKFGKPSVDDSSSKNVEPDE